MNKLSCLQKTILAMAKQQGHVFNSDILKAVYGFEQTVYTKGNRFESSHIGRDRYLSAPAVVERSAAAGPGPDDPCHAGVVSCSDQRRSRSG